MYTQFFTLLPIATLAVAASVHSALEVRNSPQCNTGSIQCCNNTYNETDPTVSELTGLLGIVLPAIEGLIGLGCTPITVIGTGSGAACAQQPVCCTDDSFNGLFNLGCSPVNVDL